MPHHKSNILSQIFYSSIGAEILRIARTSSDCKSFTESSKKLLGRMFRQGAIKEKVIKTLKRAYGRHDILKKFDRTASLLANKLVN